MANGDNGSVAPRTLSLAWMVTPDQSDKLLTLRFKDNADRQIKIKSGGPGSGEAQKAGVRQIWHPLLLFSCLTILLRFWLDSSRQCRPTSRVGRVANQSPISVHGPIATLHQNEMDPQPSISPRRLTGYRGLPTSASTCSSPSSSNKGLGAHPDVAQPT